MRLPASLRTVLIVVAVTASYLLWFLVFVWAYQFVTGILSFLLFAAGVLVVGLGLMMRASSDRTVWRAYRDFFELFRRE